MALGGCANGFGIADVERMIPYTANTRQPIASISKTFIGLAIMKAQELGRLRLDDPIAKHLPFTVENPYHPGVPITVRHLVTHTSSINDDREYLFRAWILRDTTDLARNLALDIGACRFSAPHTAVPMEEFLRRYLAKDGAWYSDSAFAATVPGSRFAYSNIGATLAALVVEKATGQPFDAFTQQHILDPLGMRSSTWHGELLPDNALSCLYARAPNRSPLLRATIPMAAWDHQQRPRAPHGRAGAGHRTRNAVEQAGAEYFREQLGIPTVDRAAACSPMSITSASPRASSEGIWATGGDPGSSHVFRERDRLGPDMVVNTDLESWEHHKPCGTWSRGGGVRHDDPARTTAAHATQRMHQSFTRRAHRHALLIAHCNTVQPGRQCFCVDHRAGIGGALLQHQAARGIEEGDGVGAGWKLEGEVGVAGVGGKADGLLRSFLNPDHAVASIEPIRTGPADFIIMVAMKA
ncbi:MAG: beta-lactamase family protein [Flavobacteriales bacterium]|nr:beta-lactamase family protein [Flavobacteriales bacterium]